MKGELQAESFKSKLVDLNTTNHSKFEEKSQFVTNTLGWLIWLCPIKTTKLRGRQEELWAFFQIFKLPVPERLAMRMNFFPAFLFWKISLKNNYAICTEKASSPNLLSTNWTFLFSKSKELQSPVFNQIHREKFIIFAYHSHRVSHSSSR